MEVYVIRHTKVEVPKGICYGQTDVALAATFEEEMKELKRKLPENFDLVFSSPLTRCKQFALQFSDEITYDNRLKEMYFGEWEMKAWSDIPLEEIQPWYDDFVFTETPNGDSFESLYLRCASFLEELRQQKATKILLVTHGGIIRSIWAYLLDIPLQNAFKVPVDFGEVFHFNLGKTPQEDIIIQKK